MKYWKFIEEFIQNNFNNDLENNSKNDEKTETRNNSDNSDLTNENSENSIKEDLNNNNQSQNENSQDNLNNNSSDDTKNNDKCSNNLNNSENNSQQENDSKHQKNENSISNEKKTNNIPQSEINNSSKNTQHNNEMNSNESTSSNNQVQSQSNNNNSDSNTKKTNSNEISSDNNYRQNNDNSNEKTNGFSKTNELNSNDDSQKEDSLNSDNVSKNDDSNIKKDDINNQKSNNENQIENSKNSSTTSNETNEIPKSNKKDLEISSYKQDIESKQISKTLENEQINQKEQLKKVKEKLISYRTLKNNQIKRQKRQNNEPKLKEVEMSKENQDFMQQLEDLPNFEERSKSDGYSINTKTVTEVNDTIIKALIIKFLNQRFLKKKTDLNIRSKSLEKDSGFLKWDVKNIIRHLETEELSKVLNDKYGYKYENGKNESVPLSFYFDMSGSMYNYTNMLAVIAIELLKRNVKVLVGFNEYVEYQINSIDKNLTVQELATILKNRSIDNKIKAKIINTNIDEYLIKSKAEKCVVFSDFDPIYEVCNLSNYCQVYWFCFENNFNRQNIQNFYGFLYKVQNLEDIANGLIKVNTNHFKALVYLNDRKR